MSAVGGTAGRSIVIGVGNIYRLDDGVGPAVVQRLQGHDLGGATLAESDGEPSQLLELWTGAGLAVVIDAVRTRQPQPGRIHRWRLGGDEPRTTGPASSHAVDLGDAVALALALDRMPGTLVVYAVEVGSSGFGTGLTPPVEAAADAVAAAVTVELAGVDADVGGVR